MNDSPLVVALAILYRDGKFLMQLRDDIPNILYPGRWALFGGHLEPGESPEIGLKRELLEEIGYQAIDPTLFRLYSDRRAIRHIYYAPLNVPVEELNLQEGWDLGLIEPTAIERGECYSVKAQQVRPLGDIHQQILCDFLKAEL